MTADFDTVIAVDWSARSKPSPLRPTADAIWIGVARASGVEVSYHRARAGAEAWLSALLRSESRSGRRVLAGFDFPFGYPAGFAAALTGTPTARAVWSWIAAQVHDGTDNANDRFALADRINAMFPAPGPFWGRPAGLTALRHLPTRKYADYAANGLSERRQVETTVPRAQPVWKLFTTGSVGSQSLLGLPMIHRLAAVPGTTVWPFDTRHGDVVLAEIYPSLLAGAVSAAMDAGDIKDAVQVRLTALALWRLAQNGGIGPLLNDVPVWPGRAEEGWILGAAHRHLLGRALRG